MIAKGKGREVTEREREKDNSHETFSRKLKYQVLRLAELSVCSSRLINRISLPNTNNHDTKIEVFGCSHCLFQFSLLKSIIWKEPKRTVQSIQFTGIESSHFFRIKIPPNTQPAVAQLHAAHYCHISF